MKRYIYVTLTLVFLSLWSSCRNDFEFKASTGNLEFSRDTVYLDTVFTNIGSSTYNLKVYNRSNEDIVIPSLKLKLGDSSNYRLNVDGQPGKTFENVEIQAKDSIFIFVETTIDFNDFTNPNGNYLYTDQIEFDTNSNLQTVELVTLVQDAVFIYPNRNSTTNIIETLILNVGGQFTGTNIQGRDLRQNELTFTNQKPYVIYGFAAVPVGETLTIEAGARIHFHENSGIVVSNAASIHVNGAPSTNQELLENEVIFEGDRLESSFANIPGQWGTIWLVEGSFNNIINHATIKNATVGVLSDGNPNAVNNKLNITNTQIYNSSAFGILGRNSSIFGSNVVINNTGQSSFAGTFGGKYNFTHCTIANYWNTSFRQFPTLLLNNFVLDENNTATLTDLTEANFNNCIIYGNDNPEILLDEIEDDGVAFNFKFTNCLIRFDNSNGNLTGDNFDLEDTSRYQDNIFNKDPNFLNTELNQLIIGEESEAIGKASPIFANQAPTDILDVNRTSSPDIGAYQHIIFPKEDK